MHPIIEAYLEGQKDFVQSLERLYDKGVFFERVLLEVYKAHKKASPSSYELHQQIDQAIVEGHPDESVYLLLITASCFLFFKDRQIEKIAPLLSIGSTLRLERIPNVVRAFYLQAESLLLVAIKRRHNEAVHKVKQALGLVAENHPRYVLLFANYVSLLCSVGKLKDLTETEFAFFEKLKLSQSAKAVLSAQLSNSFYTADIAEGYRILDKFNSLFPKGTHRDQEDQYVLKVLSGNFSAESYQKEEYQILVCIFSALVRGAIEEAIRYHKDFVRVVGLRQMSSLGGISHYIPVHIALCLQKPSETRSLLEIKDLEESEEYIDDFFLVRILLLEKRYDDARCVMQRLMRNIKHYGALSRILFELQFAKELSSEQFFLLMYEGSGSEVSIQKTKKAIASLKGANLLIGSSRQLQKVRTKIRKYASLCEPILVLGETGTGKELVAKALHEESALAEELFFAINCGALTDSLLESELFGYEAGAFTGALKQKKGIFEAAGKGTVFLDEFGDISPKLQVSLLRVLESGEIRMLGGVENKKIACRIVVATNKNLEKAVKNKEFREDLYYRLNRFEITLPALRERKEDIPNLIQYFLQNYPYGSSSTKQVTNELLKVVSEYSWPGNIRELKNAVDLLKVLNPDKDFFDVEDLEVIKFQEGFSKRIMRSLEKQMETRESASETSKVLLHDSVLETIHEAGLQPTQRIAYMRELFSKYKILTRHQIMKIVKVNPIAATKELRQLCDEGFIIRRNPNNSPRSVYFELKE